jgi:hypothetical protein
MKKKAVVPQATVPVLHIPTPKKKKDASAFTPGDNDNEEVPVNERKEVPVNERKRRKKGRGKNKPQLTERSSPVHFRRALNTFREMKKGVVAGKRPRYESTDAAGDQGETKKKKKSTDAADDQGEKKKKTKKKKKEEEKEPMSPEVVREVLAEKPAKSIHTKPAGTNGCRTFFADEIRKEVFANESVESYLHSDRVTEDDALYSLQLTKRLEDRDEEASLWVDTDSSLTYILRWSLDWCLEEYDPRSTEREVRLRFMEFTEQVILYRAACKEENRSVPTPLTRNRRWNW